MPELAFSVMFTTYFNPKTKTKKQDTRHLILHQKHYWRKSLKIYDCYEVVLQLRNNCNINTFALEHVACKKMSAILWHCVLLVSAMYIGHGVLHCSLHNYAREQLHARRLITGTIGCCLKVMFMRFIGNM